MTERRQTGKMESKGDDVQQSSPAEEKPGTLHGLQSQDERGCPSQQVFPSL